MLLGYAAGGRTVILSSHMLAEVEQTCSHVVVMHLGRRLAAGPVAEITGEGAGLIVGTPEVGRAVSVLGGLTGIERAEPHQDGVLVHPNGVPAATVVATLVGAGIPVERVTPNRRLEDAFLALIADGASSNGGQLGRRSWRGRGSRNGREPGEHEREPGRAPGGIGRSGIQSAPDPALRRRDHPSAATPADDGRVRDLACLALDPRGCVRDRRPAVTQQRDARPGRRGHGRRAQLRGVQLLRLGRVPARGGRGPVLRRHRGDRGELGVAAVPAGGAGAPSAAAAAEAGRGAGLLHGRGHRVPADVAGRGDRGVRLAPAAAARQRRAARVRRRRWAGWGSFWPTS